MNIDSLLEKTAMLKDKYELIARYTGEHFNIFQLMGLESREVKTHSRFIAELLDPKGSHGQGIVFLELFLSQMQIEGIDSTKAKVEIEKFAGWKNEDATEGGYIDIIIRTENFAVILENKIYAGDQENQLLRYSNYGKSNYGDKFELYYLTLQGNEASEHSTNGENVACKTISYQKEILKWIEACHEKTVNFPILRETLTQYVHLIKRLTNQTESEKMNTELVDSIIGSKENLSAFFELQKWDVINGVKEQLFELFKTQLKEVAKRLELEAEFEKDEGYLMFFLPKSSKRFYFSFFFCKKPYSNLIFQAHTEIPTDENFRILVLNALPQRDRDFSEIWVQWMDNNVRHWDDSSEPWLMIQNGEMAKLFEEKMQHLLVLLNGIEL